MKNAKWVLFLVSMSVMLLLMSIEIGFHEEWSRMRKEYMGGIPFLQSAASKEIEMRIFKMDMAISFLGFINVLVIVLFFFNNYQHLVDRWRKIRGKEPKTLDAARKIF